MEHDDPDMHMLWSPMSRTGHPRYMALRAAIQRAYAPSQSSTSEAQKLRDKYAAGARRSGDAIFYETFGAPEELLRMDQDDALCAELFAPRRSTSAPTTTQAPALAVKSQSVKPPRVASPKRFSLKRPRESSGEKEVRVRKPRLSDTTNILNTSTETMTMTTPWDRHHVLKPSAINVHASVVTKPFGTSRFGAILTQTMPPPSTAPTTTSAFSRSGLSMLPRPTNVDLSTITSTRAYALR